MFLYIYDTLKLRLILHLLKDILRAERLKRNSLMDLHFKIQFQRQTIDTTRENHFLRLLSRFLELNNTSLYFLCISGFNRLLVQMIGIAI